MEHVWKALKSQLYQDNPGFHYLGADAADVACFHSMLRSAWEATAQKEVIAGLVVSRTGKIADILGGLKPQMANTEWSVNGTRTVLSEKRWYKTGYPTKKLGSSKTATF